MRPSISLKKQLMLEAAFQVGWGMRKAAKAVGVSPPTAHKYFYQQGHHLKDITSKSVTDALSVDKVLALKKAFESGLGCVRAGKLAKVSPKTAARYKILWRLFALESNSDKK